MTFRTQPGVFQTRLDAKDFGDAYKAQFPDRRYRVRRNYCNGRTYYTLSIGV